MNCVNSERSKCPWTGSHLPEALAGVGVSLINTFLDPKSPRRDSQVRASRFCCASRASVHAGFVPFPGPAGCWHCCARSRVQVTALITPGHPRCAQSLGKPRTRLCSQTASSGSSGSVPLLLLKCHRHRREFLLWMPSWNFKDRWARSLQCWSGIGAFWKKREGKIQVLGDPWLGGAFPLKKSSSYLPFSCEVWEGIRLLMLALLSPGSWITPYLFWSML